MSFPVFYLTKLAKELSLNLEGKGGFEGFLGVDGNQNCHPKESTAKKLLLFIFLY
jgi:hypothetical protein